MLDTLGIGLIVPVTPRLVGSFVGGEISDASHMYGFFVAAYAAMQFVFAPILGGLSDRFGRRKVILGSLFGASIDYLFMAFAPSLGWLFVGRLFSGITGASFSAASAYIADVTPPAKRAQAFGLIGASFGFGFVIGPGIGGLLSETSVRLPFMVAAGLNLLNFAYGLFVLPESLAPEHRRPFSMRRANPLASLRNLGKNPVVFGLTATIVCASLGQMILQSIWALYAQGRYGWSGLQVGMSLTAVGLATAVVSGGLLRLLIPKLGERRALVAGSLVSIAGFVAFGLASQGWMVYALIVPFALRGLVNPSAQAIITREVGPSEQGQLQGSITSVQSVTAIVGPLISTNLFAFFNREEASPRIPGMPFFAAAALDAIGLVCAIRLFVRLRRREDLPATLGTKAAVASEQSHPDTPSGP